MNAGLDLGLERHVVHLFAASADTCSRVNGLCLGMYLPGSGILSVDMLAGQAQELLHLEDIASPRKCTGCEGHLTELRDFLIQGLGNLHSKVILSCCTQTKGLCICRCQGMTVLQLSLVSSCIWA